MHIERRSKKTLSRIMQAENELCLLSIKADHPKLAFPSRIEQC